MKRPLTQRELKPSPLRFMRDTMALRALIDRLGHTKTLRGHEGCVNCLQWNSSGTLLASGSDDMNICLWNCDGRLVHSFKSDHVNNIFSVQFLPSGHDQILLSAAGDSSVRMHSYTHQDVPYVWWSAARVKRLAVTRADPHLFWSAAEDGIIKQYDVRTSEATPLLKFENKECKSLAINENRPEMIAVALNEAPVPLYDRRNVSEPLVTLQPGHIPISDVSTRHVFRTLSVTHVGFNSLGNELIVNIGGEQIYIFNVLDRVHEADVLETLETVLDKPQIPDEKDSFVGFECCASGRFKESRERAKIHFNNKEYTDAIEAYSRAILECEQLCGQQPQKGHPHAMDLCLLLSNRAASYLRRLWDGDAYASLIDLLRALKIEPRSTKVLYRIIKALMELKQYDMASRVAKLFEQFPSNHSCDRLNMTLRKNMDNSPGRPKWERSGCADYVQRLCGHCNTNTDIKEAVWFGGRDEYIAAGSDCGSLLIWERKSGALVKAFEADKNILNCVQPHPSSLLLATSGIEHVVRFWEPTTKHDSDEEDEPKSRERYGLTALSMANQKRMHTGILDMVVASIGFAVQREEGDEDDANGRRIGCSTS